VTDTYGDRYHAAFWASPAAPYLLDRGLLHSTIERFRIGFVSSPAPGHARYRGRIAIPYEDGMGRERGIRYRKMPDDPHPAKYLGVKGFNHLFAVRASDYPVVYLTEGELDAMILWQLGYRAVGVPGTQTWQDEWRFLFRNCDEVVITFDNDEPKLDPTTGKVRPGAGQLGAMKVWRSLDKAGVVTRTTNLPRGMDVNEALLELGEKQLRALLEVA
jgi:DNA primase